MDPSSHQRGKPVRKKSGSTNSFSNITPFQQKKSSLNDDTVLKVISLTSSLWSGQKESIKETDHERNTLSMSKKDHSFKALDGNHFLSIERAEEVSEYQRQDTRENQDISSNLLG